MVTVQIQCAANDGECGFMDLIRHTVNVELHNRYTICGIVH